MDLSRFKIYPENVDSGYYRIVISRKISDIVSNLYYTDSQISYFLKMSQKEYTNALQGQFNGVVINNNTLIPKEQNFEDVKSFLDSLILINEMDTKKEDSNGRWKW